QERVEKSYDTLGKMFEGRVLPAADAVSRAAEAPLPPRPKQLPMPPGPDLKARPFLDVESKQSLPALIAGLGQLATTIIGARGAPLAGLNAMNGAMTGWAE